MTAATSREVRERIVALRAERKLTMRELAALFGRSRSTVQKILADYQERGTVEPRPHGGGQIKRFLPCHEQWLNHQVQQTPLATSYELTASFNERHPDNPVSRSTIQKALQRLGYTYKKNTSCPRTGAQRRDQKARGVSRKTAPDLVQAHHRIG